VQAGHFEIIGLWALDIPSSYGGEDTHVLANVVRDLWKDSTDTINVYDVLEALFYERDATGAAVQGWACGSPTSVRISGVGTPTQDDDNETGLDGKERLGLDCPNVLTGTMEFYDTGTGSYQLENLLFVADFRTSNWYSNQWWFHRDNYMGGAIVYPTSVMSWNVNYYGGVYVHPAYYVNENWATTIGAGLRDGDNWDNCYDMDPATPDFNQEYSLSELERALAKSEIWYQWFIGETFDGAQLTTSVLLTYPTKHYHFFWRDWPYYNGYQLQTTVCAFNHNHSWNCTGATPYGSYWGAYYAKCGATGPTTGPWDPSLLFDLVGTVTSTGARAYVAAVDAYRGADAEPMVNLGGTSICTDGAHGSIAAWFQSYWKNGPIYTEARMWDLDEHREGSTPGAPPPGSPWRPQFSNPKTIPHEVNIVLVGASDRTGIEEASGILNEAPDWGYKEGHFVIPIQTMIGTRTGLYTGTNGNCDISGNCTWGWWWSDYYMLPPIGWVYFTHAYLDGVDGITRSALASWHYKSIYSGAIFSVVGDPQ
jgi:hypothetical protein